MSSLIFTRIRKLEEINMVSQNQIVVGCNDKLLITWLFIIWSSCAQRFHEKNICAGIEVVSLKDKSTFVQASIVVSNEITWIHLSFCLPSVLLVPGFLQKSSSWVWILSYMSIILQPFFCRKGPLYIISSNVFVVEGFWGEKDGKQTVHILLSLYLTLKVGK